MQVAKLSTGGVVLYLKPPQDVQFASGKHVLVSSEITTNPRKINPYWVPDTLVVWVLDFSSSPIHIPT